jgi:hypothetical protein
LPNKERVFYLLTENDREEWVKHIKEAIGYSSLTDFYVLKQTIGKGKFGNVVAG